MNNSSAYTVTYSVLLGYRYLRLILEEDQEGESSSRQLSCDYKKLVNVFAKGLKRGRAESGRWKLRYTHTLMRRCIYACIFACEFACLYVNFFVLIVIISLSVKSFNFTNIFLLWVRECDCELVYIYIYMYVFLCDWVSMCVKGLNVNKGNWSAGTSSGGMLIS